MSIDPQRSDDVGTEGGAEGREAHESVLGQGGSSGQVDPAEGAEGSPDAGGVSQDDAALLAEGGSSGQVDPAEGAERDQGDRGEDF